ncbi:MAG: FoF1 ATP synthase subunit gamma [Bacillota bacterium]
MNPPMARTSPRDLRRRMSSVRTAMTITRAMKTVASLKLRKARELLSPARDFHAQLQAVWLSLDREARDRALAPAPAVAKEPDLPPGTAGNPRVLEEGERPRLEPGPGNTLLVVLTSDRGLAGAYNADVLRAWLTARDAYPGSSVVVLGSRGREALLARGVAPILALPFPDRPDLALSRYLGQLLAWAWWERGARSFLVHTRFYSALKREAVVTPCVPPAPAPATRPSRTGFLWEPSEAGVARHLLPHLAAAQVYLAIAGSRAAELAARVSAMDAATEKAGELLEELTLTYHRVRRERITRELVEASGREVNWP